MRLAEAVVYWKWSVETDKAWAAPEEIACLGILERKSTELVR